MEADAGVELICKSQILREAKVKPRVVIGDEDSSLQKAIEKWLSEIANGEKVHKLCDRNHLTKNFGKDLYALADIFKTLKKKGVIAHLKKMFKYAIAQNKGASVELRQTLECIPEHVFGFHENCSRRWCKRLNNASKQTVTLTGEPLKSALIVLFDKYAQNAYKFSVAASSQTNESLNNMIAHKSPKNKCYSKTAASDFRVASAVLVKNEGEKCLLGLREKLGLPSGEFTAQYATAYDKNRDDRATRSKLPEQKLQRIELAAKREKLKHKNEAAEGTQYRSNMGMNSDDLQIALGDIKLPNGTSQLDCDLVYFDLVTSGLRADGEILQIAAKCKNRQFSVYVKPTRGIRSSTTSLRFLNSDLYVDNKKVDALDLLSALQAFQEFLKKCSNSCILVAHNVKLHEPRLIRTIVQNKMIGDFDIIKGFACSQIASKKKLSGRKGEGAFTLSTLVNDFLNESTETESQNKVTTNIKSRKKVTFHDALFDVTRLEKLVAKLELKKAIIKQFYSLKESIDNLADKQKINSGLKHLTELKSVVSANILEKMAQNDITFQLLFDTFTKEGEESVKSILNKGGKNKKPLVTQREGVLEKLLVFMRKKSEKSKSD